MSMYEGHSKSYLPDHLTITLAFCFWYSIIDYIKYITAAEYQLAQDLVTSQHKAGVSAMEAPDVASACQILCPAVCRQGYGETVFWDCHGILLVEYMAHKSTVTADVYVNTLKSLRDALKEKRRGLLSRGVMLLHDNAPVHKAKKVQTAIAECGFQEMYHPPYSPDLAPCDYFLFRHLKKHLAGTSIFK